MIDRRSQRFAAAAATGVLLALSRPPVDLGLLVKPVPEAHDDAPVLLRLDELGIEGPTDVVGRHDAEHAQLARFEVDLDLHRLGAERPEHR